MNRLSEIRVFVSSSFRDMVEEREMLAKHTFPRLRRLCEDRGAAFLDIDLRWGITEEDAAEGKVIELCLGQVERSIPFFLGLLGESYGWIPESVPASTLRRFPLLAEYSGRSVLELEVLWGALLPNRNPKQQALFYLRDKQSGSSVQDPRTRDLRERIRLSRLPCETYRDLDSLDGLVWQQLSSRIESLLPVESDVGVRREAAAQRQYRELMARNVVGRDKVLDQLDRHAMNGGRPVLITGRSGAGKTGILACWCERVLAEGIPRRRRSRWLPWRQELSPATALWLVTHFAGCGGTSDLWAPALRRLLVELEPASGNSTEPPFGNSELPKSLRDSLYRAAQKASIVLVIDGIDELRGLPDPVVSEWFPPVLPAGVCIVASAAPGYVADSLIAAGWRTCPIEDLRPAARARAAAQIAGGFGKRLDAEVHRAVQRSKPCGNPLFLRILLDELRLVGDFEAVPSRANQLAASTNLLELVDTVLSRVEGDQRAARAGLLAGAMSLIAVARSGLQERELLDLLGGPAGPLPMRKWLPLRIGLDPLFKDRAGLTTFRHETVRRAVAARFLPGSAEVTRARRSLVDYFGRRIDSPRSLSELPWQLHCLEAWDELVDLLRRPATLAAVFRADPDFARQCWASIEARSPHRLADALRRAAASIVAPADSASIAVLAKQLGHLEAAFEFNDRALEGHRSGVDQCAGSAFLGQRSSILRALGRYRDAFEALLEQERLVREQGREFELLGCLGNQAVLLEDLGRRAESIERLREQEVLARNRGDGRQLAMALGNQARMLLAMGEGGTMRLLHEQERVLKSIGDQAGLAAVLGNQAIVLRLRGKHKEAARLHSEEERICRQLGDREGLQSSLARQSQLHMELGDFDRALALLDEQVELCRAMHHPDGLVCGLLLRASLYHNAGAPAAGLPLVEEARAVAEAHGIDARRREAEKLWEVLGAAQRHCPKRRL